eukprot:392494-Amphidinium_carterae.1
MGRRGQTCLTIHTVHIEDYMDEFQNQLRQSTSRTFRTNTPMMTSINYDNDVSQYQQRMKRSRRKENMTLQTYHKLITWYMQQNPVQKHTQ